MYLATLGFYPLPYHRTLGYLKGYMHIFYVSQQPHQRHCGKLSFYLIVPPPNHTTSLIHNDIVKFHPI
jgi:hypothetical protein